MLTKTLHWLKPKKVDYYILSEVIPTLGGGIFFFLFIFLMFQALRLADLFIIHGIGGKLLIKMMALTLLSSLPMALPVSLLIAVLVSFGRLSSDSELVALKSCGISIHRMMLPVLSLGVIVVGLSLMLNLQWVPWGERTFKTLLTKVTNTKVVTSIKEGTFTSGFFDLLVFADKVNVETNELEHVFMFDERQAKTPMTVIAQRGKIFAVDSGSELVHSAALHLNTGNIHRMDNELGTYQRVDFKDYNLYLGLKEGDDTSAVKPKMFKYTELLQYMKEIPQNTEGSRHEYRVFSAELWRRYAIALSSIIFVILGVGYGTIRTRSVRASAALIAFATIFIYWGLLGWATTLGHRGVVSPALAMQLPNIITLIAATIGYKQATW